jgi:hypothetical protein
MDRPLDPAPSSTLPDPSEFTPNSKQHQNPLKYDSPWAKGMCPNALKSANRCKNVVVGKCIFPEVFLGAFKGRSENCECQSMRLSQAQGLIVADFSKIVKKKPLKFKNLKIRKV